MKARVGESEMPERPPRFGSRGFGAVLGPAITAVGFGVIVFVGSFKSAGGGSGGWIAVAQGLVPYVIVIGGYSPAFSLCKRM